MSDELLGQTVDRRHRIDGVLGKGGFATVYRGTDIQSGRHVAIKVLDEELRDSTRSRSRFDREVEAVARLSCAHTVSLISHGEFDGAPFIIFEFVDGQDLAEVLAARERLDGDVVLHILRQVLESLHEAHAAGIIHRDLKPENVRVIQHMDDPWFVKVLDFGVARMAAPQGGNLTLDGEIIGTPRYMSPEQLLGEDPGPPSDIYSLGLVAIELLLGRSSLQGNRWADQFARLESGHFFAPAGIANAQLVAVLQRMSARNAKDRYQSALEVLAPLEILAANRTIERTVEDGPGTDATTLERDRTDESPSLDIGADTTEQLPAREVPRRQNAIPEAVQPARPGVSEAAQERAGLPGWVSTLATLILAGLVVGVLLEFGLPLFNEETARPSFTPTPAAPSIVETPPDDIVRVAETTETDVGPDLPGGPCASHEAQSGMVELPTRVPTMMYFPTSDYDPQRPHPLVVLVGDPADPPAYSLEASGIRDLANAHGFLVVATRGRSRLGPKDREDMAALIHVAFTTGCVDMSRVFVVGQGSHGGRHAHEFACSFRLAGLATHGYVPRVKEWPCEAQPPVPTIRFVGRDDPTAPTTGRKSCMNQFHKSQAQIEFEFARRHNCEQRGMGMPQIRKAQEGACARFICPTALMMCSVAGNGMWPKANGQLVFPSCRSSRPTHPIMKEIWKFFARQPPVEIPR